MAKHDVKKALKKLKAAAAAGRVEIGNAGYDKAMESGKDSVVAWLGHNGGVGFDWGIHGIGFGQLFITLSKDAKKVSVPGCPKVKVNQGRLYIDSEHMDRETVKKILCQAVDEALMDWEDSDGRLRPD